MCLAYAVKFHLNSKQDRFKLFLKSSWAGNKNVASRLIAMIMKLQSLFILVCVHDILSFHFISFLRSKCTNMMYTRGNWWKIKSLNVTSWEVEILLFKCQMLNESGKTKLIQPYSYASDTYSHRLIEDGTVWQQFALFTNQDLYVNALIGN